MSAANSKIHIARNGKLLGIFDAEKVEDMIEFGQLQPTDHFYDEETGDWKLLTERVPIVDNSGFKSADEKPMGESPEKTGKGPSRFAKRGNSSRSKAKAKKNAEYTLFGWIACLLAICGAAGIWVYAMSLSDQIHALKTQAQSDKHAVESLKREIQLLSEITPPGRVRGVITYEPSSNQVAIMSGATVGLYRRPDVESALEKVTKGNENAASQDFDGVIEQLKSAIPSPVEISLTDSNGRIDLNVPQQGDYVLVASAAKSTPNGPERYFWLVGFSAAGQPSGLILMNEKNAISAHNPRLGITNVRGLTTGVEK